VAVNGLLYSVVALPPSKEPILTYLTYLLTYLLTPWSRVLDQLTGSQQVKKFPAFYGIRRIMVVFTRACHLSLSWARWIQSMPPHLTSWRYILILSSYLHLGLPSSIFPSGFPTRSLYAPLLLPVHATCPSHLIHLDLIIWIVFGEE